MVRNVLACKQTQLRVPDPDPKVSGRRESLDLLTASVALGLAWASATTKPTPRDTLRSTRPHLQFLSNGGATS